MVTTLMSNIHETNSGFLHAVSYSAQKQALKTRKGKSSFLLPRVLSDPCPPERQSPMASLVLRKRGD